MGFGVARSVRHTLEQAAPTEATGQRRAGVVIQVLYMHKGVREDGHPPHAPHGVNLRRESVDNAANTTATANARITALRPRTAMVDAAAAACWFVYHTTHTSRKYEGSVYCVPIPLVWKASRHQLASLSTQHLPQTVCVACGFGLWSCLSLCTKNRLWRNG